MDLELREEQRLLRDSVLKMLQQESTVERVRTAEPVGFDAALWTTLIEFGIPGLRVPESIGGSDVSLLDAILVAEAAGETLAAAPIVESIVVNRLLALIDSDEARAAIAEILEEGTIASFALPDSDADDVNTVPAGAAAQIILHTSDGAIYLSRPDQESRKNCIEPIGAARIKLPIADGLLLIGSEGAKLFEAAYEEWKLLLAAQIAGATRKALQLAAEYACERTAFGRQIGSFQGLAHPLADSVTDIDGAQLLCWRAADSLARQQKDGAALISLASWWARTVSKTAVVRSMRTFGGYGVTLEYDLQLYFHRIHGWSDIAGDPQSELRLAGERLYAEGCDASLPTTCDIGLTFADSPEEVAMIEHVKQFTAEHMTPEIESFFKHSGSNDGYRKDIQVARAKAGLLFPDWPVEHGGQGKGPLEAGAAQRQLTSDGWPSVVAGVATMAGKMVMHFGSETAKKEILPKLASGEAACSLGYSEPGCGSDLFAARTTAKRDGDDWLINGQKMFTSQAHIAQYSLLLARTDSSESKHAGLTVFMVPLDSEGYSYDEVKTISNERTNVSYYEDVRVPDAYRLGEVNQGVKVLAAALAIEQGGDEYFPCSLERVALLSEECARQLDPSISDRNVRAQLAETVARAYIGRVLAARAIWAAANDCALKHYGPMAKLFCTEAWLICSTNLRALFSQDILFRNEEPFDELRGLHLASLPSTIYAGTSEVQRSLVAESALGLPRSRT